MLLVVRVLLVLVLVPALVGAGQAMRRTVGESGERGSDEGERGGSSWR